MAATLIGLSGTGEAAAAGCLEPDGDGVANNCAAPITVWYCNTEAGNVLCGQKLSRFTIPEHGRRTLHTEGTDRVRYASCSDGATTPPPYHWTRNPDGGPDFKLSCPTSAAASPPDTGPAPAPQAPPPAPTPSRAETRAVPRAPQEMWNAIAAGIDDTGTNHHAYIGYAAGPTAAIARDGALAKCNEDGAPYCAVKGAWNHGCVYATVGKGRPGGGMVGWGMGATAQRAYDNCMSGSGMQTCDTDTIGGCVD